MKYERYENFIAAVDKHEFQFESDGPKGKIKKLVQFTQTQNKNIYNLSFGNQTKDGLVNDEAIDDNKDRNKILATVGAIIYEFTSYFSDNNVFFLWIFTRANQALSDGNHN